jgi:hypothetical protein
MKTYRTDFKKKVSARAAGRGLRHGKDLSHRRLYQLLASEPSEGELSDAIGSAPAKRARLASLKITPTRSGGRATRQMSRLPDGTPVLVLGTQSAAVRRPGRARPTQPSPTRPKPANLLERRTARGGRDSIDHPAGPSYHDDLANCVAGLCSIGTSSTASYDRALKRLYQQEHGIWPTG